MKTLKSLTLLLHLLIIIGAGHGIAPLGLFEYVCVRDLISGDFHFNISGPYDDRLPTVGMVSLLGQLILIGSFFFRARVDTILTIISCVLLLIATYLLTQDAWESSIDVMSLITAVPFIGTAVVLMMREIRRLRIIKAEEINP